MLFKLKVKLVEWLINKSKKIDPEIRKEIATKNSFKILKLLDKLYKKIILTDMFLEVWYGLDSQIYIEFKDKLNILSIDKDREDSQSN